MISSAATCRCSSISCRSVCRRSRQARCVPWAMRGPSARWRCPICRRLPNRGCRASMPHPGSALLRRRGRRPPSSPNWPMTSPRCSRRPTWWGAFASSARSRAKSSARRSARSCRTRRRSGPRSSALPAQRRTRQSPSHVRPTRYQTRHHAAFPSTENEMPLQLSLAVCDYDRTRAIFDGRATIEGCDLAAVALEPEESFHRAFKFQEFDVSEMSMSSYLLTTARGEAHYVAIPAFVSRLFRHSAIYIRTDRGIARPADLKGRTLGVPEYQMTANVWVRGILSDEYGVKPSDIG